MRQSSSNIAISTLSAMLMLIPVSGKTMDLLEAARVGDFARVESLLKDKVDVNLAQANGATALSWAVYHDKADAVDLLLASGADPNIANEYGVTPLSLACANQDDEIVSKLLVAGAKPDLAKLTGETALMTCANTGSVEAVKALIVHGANVNASENKQQQTALMWAAAERHPQVVKVLVENGADVNARSGLIPEPEPYFTQLAPGESVFGTNYPETIRFPENSGGFTALHFAAQQGVVETAKILLDAGADINVPHSEHGSALIIAIASGHEEMARYLVEQGADVNVKDGWGITPLHYALHKGVLILNNFKPSDTHRFGWERNNMPALVKLLLDHGADPNAKIQHSYAYHSNLFLGRSGEEPAQVDPVGATPLLLAAASGDVESMRILVESGGADKSAKTIGGATLFMLAAGVGAERGARTQKDALEAAKLVMAMGSADVNSGLTEIAADGPGKGKEDGRTALHAAAYLGWTDVIRFLVENGADINARDRYGMTPLKLAMGDPEGLYYRNIGSGNYDERYRRPAFEGNQKVTDLLLELGAKPFTGQRRDRSGE
jgi:ankyrin repeat protein